MLKIISGIAEGQVLQRGKDGFALAELDGVCDSVGEVAIWIETQQGQPISGRLVVPVEQGKKFRAVLKGIPVGGPYEVCLAAGSENLRLKAVYVGDVWLLGGQSNMEGCGRMDVPDPADLRVRAFSMDREWRVAQEPLHVLASSPDPVHYSGLQTREARTRWKAFSHGRCGLAIVFANEMLRRSDNVPQGLICTAHGGTSMSDWDPALRDKKGESLYGSMFLSWKATGQSVAGVLWHQGESDTIDNAPEFYTERMVTFVNALRRDLGQPDLPFIMAQIGRHHEEDPDASSWKSIQHQQLKLPGVIPFLECISTIDLEMDDCIHIGQAGHKRLGVRFARMADRLVFGNESPPPRLVSAKRMKGTKRLEHEILVVELLFENVVGGFRSSGKPSGFAFVDERGVEIPMIYKTTLDGNAIRIESMIRGKLFSYRLVYGAGYAPYCSITDGRDLALPVMETIAVENMEKDGFFVLDWMVSEVLPPTADFSALPLPSFDLTRTFSRRIFPAPLFDLSKENHSGIVYGTAKIMSREETDATVFMGYDGPFKLWLDGVQIFEDLEGPEPLMIDEHKVCIYLSKGMHSIVAALDFQSGKGWGCVLRISCSMKDAAHPVPND